MSEGDGVEEVLDGAKRVVLTGAGQVLENMARRREDEARARASSAGAQAAADRQRSMATTAVKEAVRPRDRETGDLGLPMTEAARRRDAREAPTAIAVLAADDRRQAERVLEQRFGADWRSIPDLPETVAVQTGHEAYSEVPVADVRAADAAPARGGVPPVEVLIADPEDRVRGLGVDKEGTEAAVLAGRSQAKPAAEAVREQGSPARGRAPKARGRGRGADRERGR